MYFIIFNVGYINLLWYVLQKSAINLKNLKILTSKVTKILTISLKKFHEFPPWVSIHKTFLVKFLKSL